MSDIVITTQQLAAWAMAINQYFEGDVHGRLYLEQALEDMREVMADPEEVDIVDEDEPSTYDPDETSDGWDAEAFPIL